MRKAFCCVVHNVLVILDTSCLVVVDASGTRLTAFGVRDRDVHALVRLESKNDARKDATRNVFNSLGVKLVDACYEDHESLVRACSGVDVVLSCIGPRYVCPVRHVSLSYTV
jgi:uncharacterized protein YbjT (DUF2867 family)